MSKKSSLFGKSLSTVFVSEFDFQAMGKVKVVLSLIRCSKRRSQIYQSLSHCRLSNFIPDCDHFALYNSFP